jgi:hypothetical protein
MDVGEYDADIVAGFEDSDGFVCIGRTDCLKTFMGNDVQSDQMDQRLVLDNEHDRPTRRN